LVESYSGGLKWGATGKCPGARIKNLA